MKTRADSKQAQSSAVDRPKDEKRTKSRSKSSTKPSKTIIDLTSRTSQPALDSHVKSDVKNDADAQRRCMETKIKTPKSQKTPKSERRRTPETPGSNDWMCSQHFDPDAVVGWDCNSPETLRNIHRIQGDDCDTGISDIVKQLMDRSPDGDTPPPPGGTPRLLTRWKNKCEENNNKLLPRTPVRRRPRGKSRRQKAEVDAMTHDLLQKLEAALERQKAHQQEEEAAKMSEEIKQSEANDPVYDDLSDSSLIRNMDFSGTLSKTVVLPSQEEKNLTEKQIVYDTKPCDSHGNSEKRDIDEDMWSDDELFEDDSFVIKATQLPPKAFDCIGLGMKRRTPVNPDPLKAKCPRQAFQLSDSKSFQSVRSSSSATSCKSVELPESSLGSSLQHISSVSSSGQMSSVSVGKHVPNTASSISSCGRNKAPFTSKVDSVGHVGVPTTASIYCQSGNNGTLSVSSASSFCKPGTSRANVPSMSIVTSCPQNANDKVGTVRPRTFVTGSSHSRDKTTVRNNIANDSSKKSSISSISGNTTLSQRTRSGQGMATGGFACTGRSTIIDVCKTVPVNKLSSVNTPVTQASSCLQASSNSRITNITRTTVSMPPKSNAGVSAIGRSIPSSDNVNTKARETSVNSVNHAESGVWSPNTSEFDTSISDDILFQLAEPDDILDSQVFAPVGDQKKLDPPTSKTNRNVYSKKLVGSDGKTTCAQSSDKVQKCSKTVVEVNSQQPHSSSDTCAPSKRYTFKASQKPSAVRSGFSECKNSAGISNKNFSVPTGTSNSTGKPYVLRHKDVGSSLGPKQPMNNTALIPGASDTNMSLSKSDVRAGKDVGSLSKKEQPVNRCASAVQDEFSEDLFLSDDDGLTEPQILAMLDEVEMLATQQKPCSQKSNHSDSDKGHLCSSQDQVTGSQGHVMGSQGHVTGSQGQPSSSQNKYSPAEIERKKQEALERRQKRNRVK